MERNYETVAQVLAQMWALSLIDPADYRAAVLALMQENNLHFMTRERVIEEEAHMEASYWANHVPKDVAYEAAIENECGEIKAINKLSTIEDYFFATINTTSFNQWLTLVKRCIIIRTK